MNYWNIGLYETKFTKTYITVGYVKNNSTFVVLLQLNSFQRNIKFIVEGKKGKNTAVFKIFICLSNIEITENIFFEIQSKKITFEIHSRQKFT